MKSVNLQTLWDKVRSKTKARGISSLHDLDVNEISLVADPANLFSKVVISKRHNPEEDEKVDATPGHIVPDKEQTMPAMDPSGGSEEVEMLKGIVEQQEEVIDTLSKALEEVIGEDEMGKMAMEDEDTGEQPPAPPPSEDEEEEMGKMDVGIDQDAASEDFPDDELEGQDLQKALTQIPAPVANLIAELTHQLDAQADQIQKSNAVLMEREAQIRNQEIMDKANQMTGLPMTHDDVTQTLHVLNEHLPPDQYDMIEDKLVKMSDVMMQQPITKEYGSSMRGNETSSVVAKATELANQVVQKGNGKYTDAQARAAVWEADKTLYNQYYIEDQQRQRGGYR